MSLVIQGSLMLENVLINHPQAGKVLGLQEVCTFCNDHAAIAKPHMTILSSRDLKPLRERKEMSNNAFRKWMKSMISTFPPAPELVINTDVFHKARRESDDGSVKESHCLFLSNNDSFLDWRDEIMEALGVLVEDIDTSRFFHISITNLTGNPQDSVADPKPPKGIVTMKRGEEE